MKKRQERMEKYAITETTGSVAEATWTPVKAKSLVGAMRSANRSQAFQGSTVAVARPDGNGDWKAIAIREPADKLNMNSARPWRFVEGEPNA